MPPLISYEEALPLGEIEGHAAPSWGPERRLRHGRESVPPRAEGAPNRFPAMRVAATEEAA